MPKRAERTISTPDRGNDDGVAKEIFLSNIRNEIDNMMDSGHITEAQAQIIGDAINYYVQFNSSGKTRGGFERGLAQLIETLLRDLLRPANTISLAGN